MAHHCPARTEDSVDIELLIFLVPTITLTDFEFKVNARNSSRDEGASKGEIALCHLFTTSQFSLPFTSRRVENRSIREKSILLLSPRTT